MTERNVKVPAGIRCLDRTLAIGATTCVALALALGSHASAQAQAPSQPAPPPAVDPTPGLIGALHLPRDLSPWSMFASADIIVQSVMVGLAFASVVTWTVWLAKSIELLLAPRRLRSALEAIGEERSLADAPTRVGTRTRHRCRRSSRLPCWSCGCPRISPSATASRSASHPAWRAWRRRPARDMNKGTGVLATIGATAPFVGLFGTVWGIMNSFIGISKAQTTNLAVVAPGIAEALLATAIGLFAAIPAVIIYNQFARWIGGYRGLLGDASAEVLRLVSRDLDRSGIAQRRRARAAE